MDRTGRAPVRRGLRVSARLHQFDVVPARLQALFLGLEVGATPLIFGGEVSLTMA